MIKDLTRKSDEIFTVNHTYFTEVSVTPFTSHELEYCPARTIERYCTSVEQFCGLGSTDAVVKPNHVLGTVLEPVRVVDAVVDPIRVVGTDVNPTQVVDAEVNLIRSVDAVVNPN